MRIIKTLRKVVFSVGLSLFNSKLVRKTGIGVTEFFSVLLR